jgi:hypothetical protein
VCFGFGGRLVSFANHKQQVTDPMTGQVRPVDTAAISISQVRRDKVVQAIFCVDWICAGLLLDGVPSLVQSFK